MKALALVVAFLLAGCTSYRETATRTANSAVAVVEAARPYVDTCERVYASGTGAEHVARVDASGCLALLQAVDATRAVQLALRVVAMAPADPGAVDVLRLAGEAASAARAVAAAVESLRAGGGK